jgi:type VI secretion system protein ImpJ
MYLGTHHFQAQNRYFEESIHFATGALHAYAYGLISCEMDAESLRNGSVAVLHARGVFADGLVFQMPELDPLPAARAIGDHFSPTMDHCTVYLAVPRKRRDAANVQNGDAKATAETRYIAETQTVYDETNGSDQKQVKLGRKNIRLMFEGEAAEGSALLAVGRVVRAGASQFAYDDNYVPACLQIGASARLMALLQRLLEIIEDKGASLAGAAHTKTSAQSGYSAREIANFWFRHALNSSLVPLRHFFYTKRGHPEELYLELARLAGALSTFSLDANARTIPAYDHDRPDLCFPSLDARIRGHLETVLPTNCISISLERTGDYYWSGEIKDQRVLGRSNWFFAIHSEKAETDVIAMTPALVKVCSQQFVPELVKRALPGLSLVHAPVPPAALNARVETQYFSIGKSGPCWTHLIETRKIGVYVPGEMPSPEIEILVVIDA